MRRGIKWAVTGVIAAKLLLLINDSGKRLPLDYTTHKNEEQKELQEEPQEQKSIANSISYSEIVAIVNATYKARDKEYHSQESKDDAHNKSTVKSSKKINLEKTMTEPEKKNPVVVQIPQNNDNKNNNKIRDNKDLEDSIRSAIEEDRRIVYIFVSNNNKNYSKDDNKDNNEYKNKNTAVMSKPINIINPIIRTVNPVPGKISMDYNTPDINTNKYNTLIARNIELKKVSDNKNILDSALMNNYAYKSLVEDELVSADTVAYYYDRFSPLWNDIQNRLKKEGPLFKKEDKLLEESSSDTTKMHELYLIGLQLHPSRLQLQKDIRELDMLNARMINAKRISDGR